MCARACVMCICVHVCSCVWSSIGVYIYAHVCVKFRTIEVHLRCLGVYMCAHVCVVSRCVYVCLCMCGV